MIFLHGRVPDFEKTRANRSIELKDYDLYYEVLDFIRF